MKGEIQKIIEKATGISNLIIEKPKDPSHGDYSTSVALVLAKKLGKNPIDIAQEIVGKIKNNLFEKIEVAPPGFINFYLLKDYFIKNVKNINKDFGRNNNLKNKKVIVEFTDPNILKEFHIGHLMSNAIGESIARIFEFQNAKVKRTTWQSDVGLGIAKAVFGKIQQLNLSWQEAYVLGTKLYEEDQNAKAEIITLNKKIFERSDREINALYDEGKKWSLENFEAMYEKLGSDFDYLIFESQAVNLAKKIVKDGFKKGIFETGAKGAIVFKGEKFGLHTRVFINSEGLPTYEAKELALAQIKYKKYAYDKSVIITGNDINEYFKVLLTVMKQIFPKLQEKTTHIGHGNMRLPEGKMSSRAGKVVTAEFLIEKVKEMVRQKANNKTLDDTTIEVIAIGAIKYSILKQSIGSDIIYDFERSISFEGDSGPYLQYSYVRAISVLEKAKKEKVKPSFKNVPNITILEKLLCRFPEEIEKAGKMHEPHLIATYLTELAREFNNYYAKNKIVDKGDKFSPYKVAVTQAFSIIMKNGLWLLGISVPNKM